MPAPLMAALFGAGGRVAAGEAIKTVALQSAGQAAMSGLSGMGEGRGSGNKLNWMQRIDPATRVRGTMLGGAAKIAASPATVGMGIAQGAADDRTAAVIHHGKQVVSDTISTASRAAAAPLNPGNWLELAETVTSLPGKFEKLGDAATAAAKELAGFSGEMATASIEKTFGDIRRDIQTAQQTGQSTLSLTRSLENLKDIMNPIKNEITNITNILLEAAVEAVIALEPLIVQILEYVKKGVILVLKWLADILEKWFGADGLASVAADAAEKISQIERNTRPEDDMGPLGKLLSDISEGGLGGF